MAAQFKRKAVSAFVHSHDLGIESVLFDAEVHVTLSGLGQRPLQARLIRTVDYSEFFRCHRSFLRQPFNARHALWFTRASTGMDAHLADTIRDRSFRKALGTTAEQVDGKLPLSWFHSVR
jgi:hypothetical protein